MLQYESRDRKEHLHAALLKLIEANFISRSVIGQTERFSFVHTAVQEVIHVTFSFVLCFHVPLRFVVSRERLVSSKSRPSCCLFFKHTM